jgi:hypothetical protein
MAIERYLRGSNRWESTSFPDSSLALLRDNFPSFVFRIVGTSEVVEFLSGFSGQWEASRYGNLEVAKFFHPTSVFRVKPEPKKLYVVMFRERAGGTWPTYDATNSFSSKEAAQAQVDHLNSRFHRAEPSYYVAEAYVAE